MMKEIITMHGPTCHVIYCTDHPSHVSCPRYMVSEFSLYMAAAQSANLSPQQRLHQQHYCALYLSILLLCLDPLKSALCKKKKILCYIKLAIHV
jgi:hypothetical protein